LRATTSYVGDLIFGNEYKFTEADDLFSSLKLKNDSGNDLVTYYREGKVGIGSSSQSGSLCIDDGTGVCDGLSATAGDIYYNAAHAAYTDVAENYPTDDETLGAGEVVQITKHQTSNNTDDLFIERADGIGAVLGIISTNPGLTLGDYGKESRHAELVSASVRNVPVALSGRVPVKVSLENGNILRGDYLTLSKKEPGAATKLIGSGQVIGIAMQNYNGSMVEPLTKDQNPYQVMTFIQQFYQYDDESVVRIFNPKLINIQQQIDDLKSRVEELEKWRTRAGE